MRTVPVSVALGSPSTSSLPSGLRFAGRDDRELDWILLVGLAVVRIRRSTTLLQAEPSEQDGEHEPETYPRSEIPLLRHAGSVTGRVPMKIWYLRHVSDDPDAPRWWLYLLGSSSRTYVGITTELERRLAQHNGELPGGAKSTRPGRPWVVLRQWGPYSRSEASSHEYRLKRCPGRRRSDWEPEV